MNLDFFITRLTANAEVITALVRGVSEEQARWKPDEKEWSILEVLSHLYDEERDDFRTRLDYSLNRPGEQWPPIDPEGWAIERKYNERDFKVSLDNFLMERKASLEWLQTLENPDWQAERRMGNGQSIHAGDFLASWAAHDLIHIHQIADLHRAYISQLCAPFSTAYAGA